MTIVAELEPRGASAFVQVLVAGKLVAPLVRAGYVARPRLMDALDAGGQLGLTVVDAPTGYGKTMLVAAWCASRVELGVGGCAWLSLEASENDPALLARYVIAALRRAGAEIGERAEMMLRVPGSSPIACLASLVNDLGSLPAPMVLVLVLYDVVVNPACDAMVQFLVEHGPSGLRVIVCTRADPQLGLGALRAAAQLSEIRAAELRFSVAEAEQLLVEREGLALDRTQVARLAARTEGWAAGLYLASLWLRGREIQEADVERFAGENRHIADYLSEVVLGRLDDGVREFLLWTSIAERLCGSLCEAITSRPAAGMLEEIERSNQFLVPLDESRTWYRYHHLFREMLSSELARRHPGLVAELHRRASAWYRDAGLVLEAVEHATAARDFDSAAGLVRDHWLEVGRWGQEATILRWLAAFDRRQLRRYPELGFIGAMVVGVAGGTEAEFRGWLEFAEQGLSSADDGRPVAGTTSLRAGINLLHSTFGYRDLGPAAAAGERAVRMESEAQGEFRVIALANLAFLRYLAGDLAGARHAVSEALRDPQAQRRPYGYIVAVTTAALIAIDEGQTEEGERTAQRALDYATAAGLADTRVTGLARIALGRALATARRTKSAAVAMRRGESLLRGGVILAWHVYALLWTAPVVQADGDHEGALGLIDEAERLLASFEDAGTLVALLADVKRTVSLGRPRRRDRDRLALSGAELAVLRLLASPRCQRAIAQELSISINTVKTHTSVIYRKLGVGARGDAVARALELHLI